MRMHPSITEDRVVKMVQQYNSSTDNPGACIACGADATGCEPDARRYKCESCGARAVYGAQELLIMIV